MSDSSRFFQNRACPYFPCHTGIDPEEFNCLFCYCPLYALGRHCGGACVYLPSGCKDCSACVFPHRRENYDRVLARWADLQCVVALVDAQENIRQNPAESPLTNAPIQTIIEGDK